MQKIDKTKIKKVLKIFWSDEDNCYLCQHPDYDRVIGIGNTKKEAEKIFFELLDDFIPYILAGKVVNKGGRPQKNNVKLCCNIPGSLKEFIDFEAKEKGVNQAVIIEEALNIYKANKNIENEVKDFAKDLFKVFKDHGFDKSITP